MLGKVIFFDGQFQLTMEIIGIATHVWQDVNGTDIYSIAVCTKNVENNFQGVATYAVCDFTSERKAKKLAKDILSGKHTPFIYVERYIIEHVSHGDNNIHRQPHMFEAVYE